MVRLTPGQISHLTRLMDERYTREMHEINAVAARSRDERGQEVLTGSPADQLDLALADIALAADYAVVKQDVADVRDIIAARKRLADGRYGICVECGAEIGYARLQAYPTAKRCIECQREHERKRAQRTGRRVS